MRNKEVSLGLAAVLATFLIGTLIAVTPAIAQTEKILHSFNSTGMGGDTPEAGLIFDSAGNLYSTTTYGSTYNDGTVFELSPPASVASAWTERARHVFGSGGHDGAGTFAGVIFDFAGNLYGVTGSGGLYGYGNVFELSPSSGGGWTEKIIHNFNQDGTDGTYPFGGLVFDTAGNLYGTTTYGGANNQGVVFELTPSGSLWTETIIHSFFTGVGDGANPEGTLIIDAAGNLYGTAPDGGAFGTDFYGVVFKLSPGTGGTWTETVIHSFGHGSDGNTPQAALLMDSSGNLYGTTSYGGADNKGTAFELTPTGGGSYTEKLLHSFGSSTIDGNDPVDSLVMDSSGNLYGTTAAAGLYGFGTAFELSPRTGGGWTERTLHEFGSGVDGQFPVGNLIFDASGNLYGTTLGGGAYAYGTVFEIIP